MFPFQYPGAFVPRGRGGRGGLGAPGGPGGSARFSNKVWVREEATVQLPSVPVPPVRAIQSSSSPAIPGTMLGSMCSAQEARERESTRQLDRFELGPEGTLDLDKAVKKYQRSSADKKYKIEEIRDLATLKKTIDYLFTQILDFDLAAKGGFSDLARQATYTEIYSFMRDRLRAVRVDLQMQPAKESEEGESEILERCIRFELLSIYLLSKTSALNLPMLLASLSQSIDPLLATYRKKKFPGNFHVHKYILILGLAGGGKTFKQHLNSLPMESLRESEIAKAREIGKLVFSGQYGRVLEIWKDERTDFLTACAMTPLINDTRKFLLRRISRVKQKKIPITLASEMLKIPSDTATAEFLEFHGVKCENGNFWFPDGSEISAGKCEFKNFHEPVLEHKFPTQLSRLQIVFGNSEASVFSNKFPISASSSAPVHPAPGTFADRVLEVSGKKPEISPNKRALEFSDQTPLFASKVPKKDEQTLVPFSAPAGPTFNFQSGVLPAAATTTSLAPPVFSFAPPTSVTTSAVGETASGNFTFGNFQIAEMPKTGSPGESASMSLVATPAPASPTFGPREADDAVETLTEQLTNGLRLRTEFSADELVPSSGVVELQSRKRREELDARLETGRFRMIEEVILDSLETNLLRRALEGWRACNGRTRELQSLINKIEPRRIA